MTLSPRIHRSSRAQRAVLLLAPVLATSATALDLVKAGAPVATIVVPEGAAERTSTAAAWLRSYVARATGTSLDVVSEHAAPTGTLIAVGHTKMAQEAGIGVEGLKWDGCRLAVGGRVLFLIGRDQEPLRHLGAHGTGRAVVTLLEDFLGVRWFLPGPEGDHVPTTTDLSVPDDLDKTVNPQFAYMHGRYLYGGHSPGAIANNNRTAVKVRSYGGHSYYSWVPEAKYFQSHPEYFALRRSARHGVRNHLCSSNPEVAWILLRKIREDFDSGYDWVQLGQEDGYARCECPQCEKLDRFRPYGVLGHLPREEYIYKTLRENPCERVLLLHKWIADRCRESHPEKKVHLLVYGPTLMPSKLFDRFGDNVVGELCSEDPRCMALWRDKVHALTEYVYWWYPLKGIRPMFTPGQVAEHVRHLRDSNVIGIYQTANINWGLEGPNYYTLGKLVGNSDLDPDALADEYCRGVYPEVAERMKGFFNLLYSRVRHSEALDETMRTMGCNMQETRFLTLYTPDLMQQLDRMLTLAEERATAPRTQGWLRHTRDHFEFLKRVSRMFASYRAYQADSSADNFFELKARVDTFEQWREQILGYDRGYIARWFPGYHVTHRYLTHKGGAISYYTRRPPEEVAKGVRGEAVGFGRCAIRAPLTWDFERMAEHAGKKIEGRSLVVKRTAHPPKLDGRMAPEEWQAAERAELGTVGGGAVRAERTTVRALYDDNALYLAWECIEPRIERLRVKSVGRDGAVYSLDCVELLLDPSGGLDSYKHFMAAPADSAYYDAQVTNVLADPHKSVQSAEDKTYNPDWQYAFHVNREAKCWTIEMRLPFRALETQTPKPGAKWFANFGRERYVGDDLSGLYLWSPSNTGSFRNVFAFGALYFDHRSDRTGGPPTRARKRQAEAATQRSLIVNGSFETCVQGSLTQPDGWTLRSYPDTVPSAPVLKGITVTGEKTAHGSRALKVDPQAMDLAALRAHPNCHLLWSQGFDPLLPKLRGKRVRFTVRLYFECAMDLPHPNPFFILRPRGAKDHIWHKAPAINVTPAFLASQGYGSYADCVGKWLEVEAEGVIPPETVSMDLHCGMRGKVDGKANETCVYVDAVRLEAVGE